MYNNENNFNNSFIEPNYNTSYKNKSKILPILVLIILLCLSIVIVLFTLGKIGGNKKNNSSTSNNTNVLNYIKRANSSEISVKDEIAFGSEEFYIIWSNQDKTALLSKYNVIIDSDKINTDKDYVQNDKTNYLNLVKGGTFENFTSFSYDCYWETMDGLITKYSYDVNGNKASYSGNPYPYVYTSNMPLSNEKKEKANISFYVNKYVDNLINNFNLPSTITGRLMSYEELYDLIDVDDRGDEIIPEWLDGRYWLGSARGEYVFQVNNAMIRSYDHISISTGSGSVRPVIIIDTEYLK